jgi:hypothetical protein
MRREHPTGCAQSFDLSEPVAQFHGLAAVELSCIQPVDTALQRFNEAPQPIQHVANTNRVIPRLSTEIRKIFGPPP